MLSLDAILTYLSRGGFVMWPLALGAMLLWYALGYRLLTLRRGSMLSTERLVQACCEQPQRQVFGLIDAAARLGVRERLRPSVAPLRERLEDAFRPLFLEMQRFGLLVQVIVVVAPLAGLLGTVTGMIETFDALGDMSLYSQSGGIAGGISQALLTTQMGLAVAIPGLIVGQLLQQREASLAHELELLQEVILDLPQPEGVEVVQDTVWIEPSTAEEQRVRRQRSSGLASTPIDISPLIDMVFILLIFFMVSTTFIKDMQIELSRPSASKAPASKARTIKISIDRSGQISLERSVVRAWMLQSRVRQMLREAPVRPVLVVTHRLVRSQRLIEVIDQCRLAGAKDVGVAKISEAG